MTAAGEGAKTALRGLDEGGVRALAARLAQMVDGRALIHLAGPVGAGKTVFAAQFLSELGVGEACPSPSYSLLLTYEARGLRLGHMDFFRLTDPGEWRSAGLADLAEDLDVCLIEWPSNAGGLPAPDLRVDISPGGGPSERNVEVSGFGEWGEECCARLSSH